MNGDAAADGIAGVIVLYRPADSIRDHLDDLSRSVDRLIVVVNDIDERLRHILLGVNATIIENEDNVGLATALNQGIAEAFSIPAVGYVLLLDQDSRPSSAMPAILRVAYEEAARDGLNPGCVGPVMVDLKATRNASYGASATMRGSRTLEAVATSGSMIGRAAFETVGPMRDDLFIDCIDYEWCFRARGLGFDVLQAPEARMTHDMGEVGLTLLGRYRPMYRSPTRHYYIIRNTVFLARLRHVPTAWKIVSLLKTVYRAPFYILISRARGESIRRIVSAIMDGLTMPMAPARNSAPLAR